MRIITGLIFLCAIGGASAVAQIKAVHFKKLQECLPSADIPDFERGKPRGTSQTSMGMSTSEAEVTYTSIVKEDSVESEEMSPAPTVNVSIKISDLVSMPYALAAFTMQQDYEQETEDGYEKSVTVAGRYKGMEKARTSEDYGSCELSFGVMNRFMVSVNVSGRSDTSLVRVVIDNMDLKKLEALALQ